MIQPAASQGLAPGRFTLADFDFDLPEGLIAQQPAQQRT
ncbi:MAG: tRNA preQ1(34) S-adenosylmethionine ribosyltransferase-isomerase QueA, partial [Betaproteobacteria bacterium]|nr:tRNA preQ1(34) S-adenosylmethionine ribosyltransferase-isomerase QueA [Betaproteobacteria bacterium]NDE73886.1 tRNA preQ1(34) S-adenosylmethionine ribosyltransferase-isomerase QueA [Betaproteobacteria bacterium]